MAQVAARLSAISVDLTLSEAEARTLQDLLRHRPTTEAFLKEAYPSNGTRGERQRLLDGIQGALRMTLEDADLAREGKPKVVHMHAEDRVDPEPVQA